MPNSCKARKLVLERATSATAAANSLRQSHEGLPTSEPNAHRQRSVGNSSADEISRVHRATLTLDTGAQGRGLRVTVLFP